LAGERRPGVRARGALLIALLAGAAAGAIVFAARATQNAQIDADMREIQEYRLSMAKVQQMNDAYLAFFKSLQSDPKFLALQKAREELRALENKANLTEAVVSPETSSDQQSLADMTRRIESQPRFAEAVKQAGLTPREFAKIQVSLMQAMFAHGFKKAGAVKELPKEVPAENVKFVEEHEAQLTAMAKQWQSLGNQGGAGGKQESGAAEEEEEEEENGAEAP
jgi:hypothetical protein